MTSEVSLTTYKFISYHVSVKEHTNLEIDAFLKSAQVHKIRKSINGKSEVLYLAVN